MIARILKRIGSFLVTLSVPAALIGALAFFTVQVYRGEYGHIALDRAQRDHAAKLQEVETLEAELAALERRNRGLRPDTLDLDLLDERARDSLGMIGRDEVFLISQ